MTPWFLISLFYVLAVLFVLGIVRAGHYKAQSYAEYLDEQAEKDRQLQSYSSGGYNP